jgi:hypothetical protein
MTLMRNSKFESRKGRRWERTKKIRAALQFEHALESPKLKDNGSKFGVNRR